MTTVPQILKTDSRKIKFMKEDTVLIKYHDNVNIGIEEAKNDQQLYQRMTRGRSLKKLIIAGKSNHWSKDAKSYLKNMKVQHQKEIIAEAIVVQSFLRRLLGNLCIGCLGNPYPVRLFTSVVAAKSWLRKHH